MEDRFVANHGGAATARACSADPAATAGLARAISTAGGVKHEAIDAQLMAKLSVTRLSGNVQFFI